MNRTKRHSTRAGFHVAVAVVHHGILMMTVMSELSPLGLWPYCSGSDDDRSVRPSVARLSVIAILASPVTYCIAQWTIKLCVLNKKMTFTAYGNWTRLQTVYLVIRYTGQSKDIASFQNVKHLLNIPKRISFGIIKWHWLPRPHFHDTREWSTAFCAELNS
jgi:hypothetical protein